MGFFSSFRLKKIAHPLAGHYQYAKGRLFNPGAQNLAFEQTMANPQESLLGIGGLHIVRPLMITQPPPAFVSQAIPLAGMGTFAGQMISQPLVNADNSPLG